MVVWILPDLVLPTVGVHECRLAGRNRWSWMEPLEWGSCSPALDGKWTAIFKANLANGLASTDLHGLANRCRGRQVPAFWSVAVSRNIVITTASFAVSDLTATLQLPPSEHSARRVYRAPRRDRAVRPDQRQAAPVPERSRLEQRECNGDSCASEPREG